MHTKIDAPLSANANANLPTPVVHVVHPDGTISACQITGYGGFPFMRVAYKFDGNGLLAGADHAQMIVACEQAGYSFLREDYAAEGWEAGYEQYCRFEAAQRPSHSPEPFPTKYLPKSVQARLKREPEFKASDLKGAPRGAA